MLEHLIADMDNNPYAGGLISQPNAPMAQTMAVVANSPAVTLADPDPVQVMTQKLQQYNVDLPFTSKDKRRIVENLTFNEALTAVKSSDRLSALGMLGKMESINAFAAEKRVVQVENVTDLKSRILERLGIDPSTIEDAEVISE